MMWSGGKDSASALYKLRRTGFSVDFLITTLFVDPNKHPHEPIVGGTSVPLSVMQLQAQSAGCTLIPIVFSNPFDFSMDYIIDALRGSLPEGVMYGSGGYGRGKQALEWHTELWSKLNMTPLQPIDHYTNNGTVAAEDIITANIRAKIMSVNLEYLPIELHGVEYDRTFIQTLSELDPLMSPVASRNEFQTFCYDSPDFAFPINWTSDGRFTRRTEYTSDYLNFEHSYFKNIRAI